MAINLPLPHFCQLDNAEAPYGSCNVTAIAMCLAFWGIKGDGSCNGNLADQLDAECDRLGWDRHAPDALKQIVERHKLKDHLTLDGTLAGIRQALDVKQPCVIHTYLSGSGHVIAVRGYDATGFYVNDPYGEWGRDGYNTDASGANLYYSSGLIAATAALGTSYADAMALYDRGLTSVEIKASGSIWLHRISR